MGACGFPIWIRCVVPEYIFYVRLCLTAHQALNLSNDTSSRTENNHLIGNSDDLISDISTSYKKGLIHE